MNRTIKFRAWDTRINNWYFSDNAPFKFDFEKITSMGIASIAYQTTPPGIVLLQYTGLKDKNGVDIYEGDVVLIEHFAPDYESDGTVRSESEILSPCQVQFKDGSFGYTTTEFYFVPIDASTFVPEVIGNIYENPDLLKENT